MTDIPQAQNFKLQQIDTHHTSFFHDDNNVIIISSAARWWIRYTREKILHHGAAPCVMVEGMAGYLDFFCLMKGSMSASMKVPIVATTPIFCCLYGKNMNATTFHNVLNKSTSTSIMKLDRYIYFIIYQDDLFPIYAKIFPKYLYWKCMPNMADCCFSL